MYIHKVKNDRGMKSFGIILYLLNWPQKQTRFLTVNQIVIWTKILKFCYDISSFSVIRKSCIHKNVLHNFSSWLSRLRCLTIRFRGEIIEPCFICCHMLTHKTKLAAFIVWVNEYHTFSWDNLNSLGDNYIKSIWV